MVRGPAEGRSPPFQSTPARKQPRPHDQRPVWKLPGGICWLGIPKIELSVFVPGPWVVDGASPERRFSHAAITCTETFTPCKDHCFSCGDADPLAPYGQLFSCINRGRLEDNVMLNYIETRIANFALFLRLRHHKIIPHRPPHSSAIIPGRPRS